ncbi:mycodextranase [Streptomyces avermitilis]|uniref:Mycodextranase, secreted n=2 Tax=Streptomyces avermitilis TaxID=33903 RepID=Q82MD7_STRAW|nr:MULTISPECIES: discoidin domain-containing protein [Streptomyces]KUN55507.1 mycodextranase [Streptomyces avermitilis]MYS97348.1 mycodextranase [Streptomyces sp. SID5469]BAC69434.1 putative mycodextranase, secreted [Streptomyces avermitilis MA-4680 = NBRC 14893]GDY78454.1 mycodextranase [Streptomyces avermitilis]GDY87293.1 mycodextranase [Streptomyces avermitilis]
MHSNSLRYVRRMSAIGAAVALAAGLLVALAPAAHAAAGADLPFTSVEAESATTTGTKIGPDHTQGTIASEASGRQAVRLGAGQRVEFTVPRAANAVNVSYNVPDGQSGALNVYVNGTKLAKTLAVTSKYSYVDTSWIAGAKTHHFFDNARLLLGQNVQPGDKIAVEAVSTQVTVDVADFEQVAAAATKPAGAVSVTDKGADPSGQGDSTQAFRNAIAAAQGGVVWIPPGDYRLTSSLNGVQNVTLQGAGSWHSVVHTSRFIDQSSSSGGVHLKDFAVIGEVTERVDSNPDNFVNGSLGPGSSVSGMWLQHLKVGLWLTGNNDNLVVENNRILDTTADGLNLNGNARGVRVRNNFLRNNGDDALAMWSLYSPDTNSSFESNTISQPNLANGIAIYGGTDLAVKNNLISDTNALGSGIAISNQKFLDPFSPLAGTITVSGNTLVRAGAMNPNWQHPMGALRVDSYDSAIEANVSITGTTITDSPYSAFEFVSGGGHGYATKNVTVDGATVRNTGTVVVQAESQGAAKFSNVQATGVGAAGIYNCPYPAGSGTFTLTDGGGNAGWSSTWGDCSAWPQPGQGNPDPDPTRNLAKGRPATATGSQDVYTPGKAVDGDASTYWESTNNAFPQAWTVDLGSSQAVRRLVLKLPPATAWQARTQTLSVQGSTDGSAYSTVVASQGYRFDPATGNTATVTLPSGTNLRYLKLNVTANTGWPAAQFSEVEAYLS